MLARLRRWDADVFSCYRIIRLHYKMIRGVASGADQFTCGESTMLGCWLACGDGMLTLFLLLLYLVALYNDPGIANDASQFTYGVSTMLIETPAASQ
jgi:hypothetical protein